MSQRSPRCSKSDGRRVRGAWAEQLAADYLERQGYRLVARNHRCPQGELDLIAWDGDVLCFIEVRSRENDARGDPLETIDRRKILRIARAASNFLETYEGPWPAMRFDVVGVLRGEPPQITLVREAFEV